MKQAILLTPLILALAACANYNKVNAVARPTAIIQAKDTKAVIDKVTELCDRQGLQIDEATANSVICSQEASAMAQAFFGTKYGTPVRTRIKFNAFQIAPGKVKVSPRSWAESQTAFGQTKTMEVDTSDVRDGTQRFLDKARIEIEAVKK